MDKTLLIANVRASHGEWVDYARVLAALLIVYYHMPSSQFSMVGASIVVKDLLSLLFDSPGGCLNFFFITAGYFMKRHFDCKQWMKRLLLLFLVYVSWNSLCILGLNDEATFSRIYGVGTPSALCADYPLWFIRDLFVMTLMIPLMRYGTVFWILGFLVAIYGLHVNQWVIASSFVMPSFGFWIMFLLGFMLNRVNLARVHALMPKMLALVLPLWGLAIFTKLYYPSIYAYSSLMIVKSLVQGLSVALVGYGIWYCSALRLRSWVASFAPASFLCYVWHAPLIFIVSVLARKVSPELAGNSALILSLPFAILALSKVVDTFVTQRLPFLLPIFFNRMAKRR